MMRPFLYTFSSTVEQNTHNVQVSGSNPAGCTLNSFKNNQNREIFTKSKSYNGLTPSFAKQESQALRPDNGNL